ncbi:MAG: response regulator transcription factor [Hyphomicrobiaceae bacterium]
MTTGSTEVTNVISITIIERRLLLREMILQAFRSVEPDAQAFASIEEWHARSKGRTTDLILLSVSGAKRDEDAKRGIATLSKLASGVPVVVLSDSAEASQIVQVIEAGASGYISTDMGFAVCHEALKLVRIGGTYAPTSSLIASARRQDVRGTRDIDVNGNRFTHRQAAVIEALRRGKSNKIIAYELNMCESTVKVHVRNIMKRLRAKNRTEVAYLTQKDAEVDG